MRNDVAGVYAVHHTSGRVYVGSSKRVKQRYSDHLSKLKRGLHPNAMMQEAYRLTGAAGFRLEILEAVPSDAARKEREKVWKQKLEVAGDGGFNKVGALYEGVGSDASKSLAIESYKKSVMTRARSWTDLEDDERKRRAAVAANALEGNELWGLCEAYLTAFGEAGARVSPHTVESYRGGLGVLLDYASTRGVNLLRPSRDMGAMFVRALEADGLSAATLRVRLASARLLYKALHWAGITDADPFKNVKPARDKTAPWDRRQPYSEDEVRELLESAGPVAKALILLCGHAGLRVSEATALEWRDVRLGDHRLFVRNGKGGKSAWVALSRTLHAALEELKVLTDDPYVFPFRSTVTARRHLQTLCKLTGVEYKGVHALRHYAGTRLYAETGDLEDAARHLRHSNLDTTRAYAKWSDKTLKKTVGNW